MPPCLHALSAIEFSQGLSTSNALFWHAINSAVLPFLVHFVSFNDVVGCELWHELDELNGVIVIFVDEVPNLRWDSGK